MWCLVRMDFVEETDSCVSFRLHETPHTKCLFCKNYNVLSYVCTTSKHTVSAHFICNDFESNKQTPSTDGFIGIVVGGCTKHEHGTDLYRRCKEWLETIKVDNSKQKGVRVIFTKLDYPTPIFWRSFLEKIYHLYERDWVKDKICFRGLTDTMLNEAIFVGNIIQLER